MASPTTNPDQRYRLRPEYDTETRTLTMKLDDISTAGQVYIPCPYTGTVTNVYTVINGAIATADAVLTVKNNAGTSMGTITVANASSAAGDKDSLAPSANNTVTAGDSIEVETNGASTNTVEVFIAVEVQLSTVESGN